MRANHCDDSIVFASPAHLAVLTLGISCRASAIRQGNRYEMRVCFRHARTHLKMRRGERAAGRPDAGTPSHPAGRRVSSARAMAGTAKQTALREAHRQRLDAAAEFYLRACYGTRTAARADEFAEYLRLARPHLSRVVPRLIGVPVSDFLRSKQLVYAQRLLRTTPLSVEKIALASAFGTGWTFHRCFKAAFGMTPAQYRREVTKCE